MYEDIKRELNFLKKKNFEGYVKFGIENNEIVAMTITTNVENFTKVNEPDNPEQQFQKFCESQDDVFFGNMDFVFKLGEIKNFNWYTTLKGSQLVKRIAKHRAAEK